MGEGNGSPLQYSCLENSRDRGAWWAAVYRVAQSRTWLKQLSGSSILIYGIPHGSEIKNPSANAGMARNMGSIPWVRKIPWSRKWQPTPGKSNERNLAGYNQ